MRAFDAYDARIGTLLPQFTIAQHLREDLRRLICAGSDHEWTLTLFKREQKTLSVSMLPSLCRIGTFVALKRSACRDLERS